MEQKKYDAHQAKDGRRQTILQHAENTAKKAGKFAEVFGFGDAARAAGRFHDVGKYALAFQARLNGSSKPYEHSTAGMYLYAKLAMDRRYAANREIHLLLAYLIAGHHAGLPDPGSRADTENDNTFLAKRKRREAVGMDFGAYVEELAEPPILPEIPERFSINHGDHYSYPFLGRMLFSALVDADFLDTEVFMSDGKIERDSGESFDVLQTRFEQYMERFANRTGKLNETRRNILQSCRTAARSDRGLFRLSVPTGGGKTLSSMAFALEHLKQNKMKRIIYVIPYISIIRQTVEIFEEIFGKGNVLGHYSTADFHSKKGENERSQAELAAENWEMPIIVATNVQFFESLYSNQPARCRKLHNIADSVILFDEVQMIPTGLLNPCFRAIDELVENYKCTALLCTATQPALEQLHDTIKTPVHEICPEMSEIYADLTRVSYENLGKLEDEVICQKLRAADAALCVLNTRKGVRQYYETLKGDGVYHLSTYMTHADLGRSIAEIRRRLAEGKRCIVLSTSLIEAGVDLDFPVVFREMAGLDSIIQAGGRCNREGKCPAAQSMVYVFQREKGESLKQLDTIVKKTEYIFAHYPDIASPEAIHAYFSLLYGKQALERKDILDENEILKTPMNYQTIAQTFRYIDKDQKLILIPNEQNKDACDAVRKGELTSAMLRRLAKDTVSVYEDEFSILQKKGVLSCECGGIAVLEDIARYDPDSGLRI